ncbi:MAG TPA: YkgJ family cysteine cluster protein [Fimbriimonadaceae bacterium]|nr:YkgJ family cysteine cluster protein [Fimbriimonadaceae bacterium]
MAKFDEEAWGDTVRETVAKEVCGHIEAKQRGQRVDVLDSTLAFANRNIADIARLVDASAASCGKAGIACGAGCAACCYVRVSILSAEALNVARHVRERCTEEERARLLERIDAYVESIAALPVESRMRHVLACPFLGEDQRCTIYEARPLACRMHHSLSREACEDAASPVPVIEDFINATVPVMEGIYNGCGEAGVQTGELEFIPAMQIALEGPNIEERWLAGERVFEKAIDLYLRDYVMRLMAEQ